MQWLQVVAGHELGRTTDLRTILILQVLVADINAYEVYALNIRT